MFTKAKENIKTKIELNESLQETIIESNEEKSTNHLQFIDQQTTNNTRKKNKQKKYIGYLMDYILLNNEKKSAIK